MIHALVVVERNIKNVVCFRSSQKKTSEVRIVHSFNLLVLMHLKLKLFLKSIIVLLF